MIQETLAKIGLSAKEIDLYLLIQKYGRLTPAQMANYTNIKRTTCYSVASELAKKGLITQDPTASTDTFIALPPQSLAQLFTTAERDLQKKKELAKRAAHELQGLGANTQFSIPQVKFVPEEQINSFLYERTPEWNESILQHDKTLWGFSNPEYATLYYDYLDWFWQHAPENLELRLFSSDAEVEHKLSKKYIKRHIKNWEGPQKFSATTLICGDYIVLVNTDKQPYYLIETRDRILSQNMRQLFQTIWNKV